MFRLPRMIRAVRIYSTALRAVAMYFWTLASRWVRESRRETTFITVRMIKRQTNRVKRAEKASPMVKLPREVLRISEMFMLEAPLFLYMIWSGVMLPTPKER